MQTGVRDVPELLRDNLPSGRIERLRLARVREVVSRKMPVLLLLILVAVPVILVTGTALGLMAVGLGEPTGLTLDHFRDTVGSSGFGAILLRSFLYALGGTLIAATLACILAFLLLRTDMPGRKSSILNFIPVATFLVPPVVLLFAWGALYDERAGLLNTVWRQVSGSDAVNGPVRLHTPLGLTVAFGAFLLPFVYVSIRGAVEDASPDLEAAARTAGASQWQTFRRVSLPLIGPSLGAGTAIAFVLGFGVFLVPAMIRVAGERTISLSMARAVRNVPPNVPSAAVWSLVLVVVALAALAARQRLANRTVHSAGSRGTTTSQGVYELGWVRWFAFAFVMGVAIALVVLPVLAAVIVSLMEFWTASLSMDLWTLDNYRNMVSLEPGIPEALVNSGIAAFTAASVGTLIGIGVATRVRNASPREALLLQNISVIPLATPPILIGLAFLIFGVNYAPQLTRLPLILAYIINFLPYAVLLSVAAFTRVHPELESAAAVNGANRRQRLSKVTVPLVARDVTWLWAFLFIVMFREVEASFMIGGARLAVAGPKLIGIWVEGQTPVAAAFGVVMLVISVGVALVAHMTSERLQASVSTRRER